MQSILQRVIDSILTVDVGTVWTHVLLIDRVDGAYRFVARGDVPTTAAPPHMDVTVGVRKAFQEIEAYTGRQLVDEDGDLITPEDAEGRGIDLFVATSSAAPALKVSVGGLGQRISTASARRAALSTYSEILDSFSLDADEGRWGFEEETLGVAQQLLNRWPDVVLLSGGTEGSADQDLLELVNVIAVALRAADDRERPTVIYAGNSDLADQVEARFEGIATLLTSDNLRPKIQEERLRSAARFLDQQFRRRQLGQIPGASVLQEWSSGNLLPTVEAFSRVVQYLSLRHEKRVLGVDVGGANTSLAVTFPNRITQTLIRTDLGLSRSAPSLLSATNSALLAGWIPGFASPEELATELLNLALHPPQQPSSRQHLQLLQAAARLAIRLTLQDAIPSWPSPYTGLTPPFDIILGNGEAIRKAPRPEQALSILLDGIQPTGIAQVLRDSVGISSAIGAIAEFTPQAAADLVETQGFESLGVVISPVGEANVGDEIMRFRLAQGEGVTEGAVEFGQMYRFPTNEKTQLELMPGRHFDLGYGPGVGTKLISQGDSVGFVIDARGRPLPLPNDLEARRRRVEEWLLYVGA